VKRSLSVIKTRASGHDPAIRQFGIGRDGICIGDDLATLSREPAGSDGPVR
jgi:hypothetical protein